MEIRKNDDRYFEWRKRGYLLTLADIELETQYKNKKITKRKRNEIRKVLNKLWINVWDFYPDKNPSVKEAFKLNFG